MGGPNSERTEVRPNMSVRVPATIVSSDVTRHIADSMPRVGFDARVEDPGVGSEVRVVFETPEAKSVFTNIVNAAITSNTDAGRIMAVDRYVAARVSQQEPRPGRGE